MKRNLFYLTILVAFTLIFGIYTVKTTVLIARDGMIYITDAKAFSEHPIETIQRRNPGYPLLIFAMHRCFLFLGANPGISTWIYAGQTVSLCCRVLSLVPLFLIGNSLVGRKCSFWGMIILIMLPYPAEFGSDVLREWPHLLFLATGMYLLIRGASKYNAWLFGTAGISAGLGHTIRSECALIVIVGTIWFFLALSLWIKRKKNSSKLRMVLCVLALWAGFTLIAAPYMTVRHKILPGKLKEIISSSCATSTCLSSSRQDLQKIRPAFYCNLGNGGNIIQALWYFSSIFSEMLMFFFMPALIIGFYCYWIRLRKNSVSESFFIFALVGLYITMLLLLYLHWGYISRRHCLPLVAFTIMFIPSGLRLFVRLFLHNKTLSLQPRHLFSICLSFGLLLCACKLSRIFPLRSDKQSYREIIGWLQENTLPTDRIAAFDRRIPFYADRQIIHIPEKADYIVDLKKSDQQYLYAEKEMQTCLSVWYDQKTKEKEITVYFNPLKDSPALLNKNRRNGSD